MNFDLIAKHIAPRFIIDVGARIGDWSKEAEQHWPKANFLLIEANKECELALEAGHLPYVIAVLSDREKVVDFFTMAGCATATGCSYYRENTPFFEGDKAVREKRRTSTLDEVLAFHISHGFHIDTPILLKLDTQGSELDILHGASHLLKQPALQAIVCEVATPNYNYNIGAPTMKDVDRFLNEHGFFAAEKLEDIVHPLDQSKIIQSDLLYIRKP